MNEEEAAAMEKLRLEHPDGSLSYTREGPTLLVHIDNDSWLIGEDGKRKKVT